MDKNQMERYREEMMKLYSRRNADDEQRVPENDEEKYPEPDISELYENDEKTEKADDKVFVDTEKSYTNYINDGYILAYVRTGDESSPVVGANVTITAAIDGRRVILASGLTDSSGTSPRFRLPVPDISHSQNPESEIQPYSLFDVSVSAEGYFNAKSVDVPVFSGVTSVQNFNMIPMPLMASPSSETVTYYNQEPDLQSGREGGYADR